jgi:hypothetical protein
MGITDVTHVSQGFAVLGFWLTTISLISYFVKHRLYIVSPR